jgi:hypothetical protein
MKKAIGWLIDRVYKPDNPFTGQPNPELIPGQEGDPTKRQPDPDDDAPSDASDDDETVARAKRVLRIYSFKRGTPSFTKLMRRFGVGLDDLNLEDDEDPPGTPDRPHLFHPVSYSRPTALRCTVILFLELSTMMLPSNAIIPKTRTLKRDWEVRMFYDQAAPRHQWPPLTAAEEKIADDLDQFNRAWLQLVYMPSRVGVGAYVRYMQPDQVTVEWIERDDLQLPPPPEAPPDATDELLRRLFRFWYDELADGMSTMASLQIIVGGPFQNHPDSHAGPRMTKLLEQAVSH